jgi:dephospho-CoA kinase
MEYFNKVSISGKISSGKTTVSDYLKEEMGYTQIRSAGYLKKLCSAMASKNLIMDVSGVTSTKMFDDEITEIIDFLSNGAEEKKKLKSLVNELLVEYSDVTSIAKKTDRVREMLQVVANRAINDIRQTIWVDACMKEMKELSKILDTKLFIHDDLRYPHEYETLRREGFVLIRLDITEEEQKKRVKRLYGDIEGSRLTHISEIALDRHVFDYNVDATQPLEDMLQEILDIVNDRRDYDVSQTEGRMGTGNSGL